MKITAHNAKEAPKRSGHMELRLEQKGWIEHLARLANWQDRELVEGAFSKAKPL